MYYLSDSHPEVFVANPRPGGIAKIKRPSLRLTASASARSVPGSRATLRSPSRKGSRVTIKTTGTTGTFDSKFFRPSASTTPKKTTREYRIKKILATSPWLLFDSDEEPDNVLPPDPVHDAMTILSAAISTIMLMASGYSNIPREQLVWTQSYLECVKDDYDHTPPNTRGIMNNIKLIDNTLTSFFDDLDPDAQSLLTGGVLKSPSAEAPAP